MLRQAGKSSSLRRTMEKEENERPATTRPAALRNSSGVVGVAAMRAPVALQ